MEPNYLAVLALIALVAVLVLIWKSPEEPWEKRLVMGDSQDTAQAFLTVCQSRCGLKAGCHSTVQLETPPHVRGRFAGDIRCALKTDPVWKDKVQYLPVLPPTTNIRNGKWV